MTSHVSNVDLSGQVALLTGGGRGIGRAYAQGLAAAGASVAITARTESQLAETVKLIEQGGGRAIAFAADVTDSSAVEQLVETVVDQLGPVDILVNNAAVASPIGVDGEIDPDEWWRTMEVNMRGPLLCTHQVIPSMIERGRGRIINITSGSASGYIPALSAYCASKAALTHWTRCIADDLRQHGISAFALTPGAIWTSMTRSLVSEEAPEELRDLANFVLRDDNATPIEQSVERFLFVASGKADVLSGRYFGIRQDIAELVSRADEIREGDYQLLHMRNLP